MGRVNTRHIDLDAFRNDIANLVPRVSFSGNEVLTLLAVLSQELADDLHVATATRSNDEAADDNEQYAFAFTRWFPDHWNSFRNI